MPLTVEDLVARMEWAARHGLSELTVATRGSKVTIRRDAAMAPAGCEPATDVRGPAPEIAAPDPAANAVTAPLAGLCHLAPEARGTAFVSVGQAVEPGQTLCMIEAMKMMTSVPAPRAGTVTAVLVEDGASVAAGEPLMRLS